MLHKWHVNFEFLHVQMYTRVKCTKYLGPSTHRLVTGIQVNVYIGHIVKAELSKLTYVED